VTQEISPHLHDEHSHEAIAARLDSDLIHGDLGDVVLGAVDGTVTTFAIVSGIAGTGLESGVLVAFILGLSNVLADGFSMGASNYLKARSDQQLIDNYRRIEEHHIDHVPEYEREEVRQIYSRKGFSGQLLEDIVATITSDRDRWVNTMLTDEWGLQLSQISPLRSGLLTFAAFLFAGLIPLAPLLLGLYPNWTNHDIFLLSAVLTSGVFLVTGALRGVVLRVSVLRSAFETLLVGGIAAAIAYLLGVLLSGILL